MLLLLSTDGTDRQTPGRYIDSALRSVQATLIIRRTADLNCRNDVCGFFRVSDAVNSFAAGFLAPNPTPSHDYTCLCQEISL